MSATESSASGVSVSSSLTRSSSRLTLLAFQVPERILELEPEQLRILADHGRRKYVIHVIVRLLRPFVLVVRQHLPEIALARVRGHAPEKVHDPVLAPVVRRHYK